MDFLGALSRYKDKDDRHINSSYIHKQNTIQPSSYILGTALCRKVNLVAFDHTVEPPYYGHHWYQNISEVSLFQGVNNMYMYLYVAVPGRTRTLFLCIIRSRYRVQSAVLQNFR